MADAPSGEEVLAKGQYGPFRATWIVGGIGVLCLFACLKFIFVDRAMDVALYPALSALPFGIVAALCWIRSGRFWITKSAVHWQSRTGAPLAVAITDIGAVYVGTRKLPCLDITHAGGRVVLGSISARDRAASALQSLGARVT